MTIYESASFPLVLSTETAPCTSARRAPLPLGRSGLPGAGAKRRISSPLAARGKQGAQHLFWVRCFRSATRSILPSSLTHFLSSIHSNSQGSARRPSTARPSMVLTTNGNGAGLFVGLPKSRGRRKGGGGCGVSTHQELPNARAGPRPRPRVHSFIPSFMIWTRSQSYSGKVQLKGEAGNP